MKALSASAFLLFIGLSAGLGRGAEPAGTVVFAHGMGVPYRLYEELSPVRRVFEERGYRFLVARTPTAGTLEGRAEALAREVRRLVPEGLYHLVGHSMGGLDARLAIHAYDLGDRCRSLTTLATPHHGSALADFVVKTYDETLEVPQGISDVLAMLGGDIREVRQLTTARLKEFNREVKNDPRVDYYSVGFRIPRPVEAYAAIPVMWIAQRLHAAVGSPENDGPVSVESSKWGTYMGTIEGDHWSETAPIPFGGRLIYLDVFGEVAGHLRRADRRRDR